MLWREIEKMNKDQIKTIYDSRFIKLYDMQYEEGRHYYVASRRDKDGLPALASSDDYARLLPDAVSCFVVIKVRGQEPKLLLNWEYRYPAGQYLLSLPAGLIDEGDKGSDAAILKTAIRELKEETGIEISARDEVKIINPFVFSTPGMTDEGNALVYMSINREEMPVLSQSGAEGAEKFQGFKLLSKKEAEDYLVRGRDENGIYYPLYTWAALMFFMGIS